MNILETKEIPARKAKTIYTLDMEKAEIIIIKTALNLYYKDRTRFFDNINPPMSTKGDAWIELAKELERTLPDTGE